MVDEGGSRGPLSTWKKEGKKERVAFDVVPFHGFYELGLRLASLTLHYLVLNHLRKLLNRSDPVPLSYYGLFQGLFKEMRL